MVKQLSTLLIQPNLLPEMFRLPFTVRALEYSVILNKVCHAW